MRHSKKGYILLEILISATILLLFLPLIGKMVVSSVKLLKEASFSFQARTFLERKAYLHLTLSDIDEETGGIIIIDGIEYIWRKDLKMLNEEQSLYTVMFIITSQNTDQSYDLSFVQKL